MMPNERRVHLRKPLQELAYLSLPSNNGGVLTDISEGGLGFHAIGPVEADGPLQIRFAIDSAERISAIAELAWRDASGKIGGLRFMRLPDGVREQIRAWTGHSDARPAAKAGIGVRSGSANLAAQASGAKNNFATRDVLVAEQPDEIIFAGDLRLDPLLTEQTLDARPTPASAVASPKWKSDSPPIHKIAEASPRERAIAAPAVKAKAPAARKADVAPAMVVSGPLLNRLRPPIYGAPFNSLSMFPLERKPETARRTAPRTAAVAAARSIAVTHPLAAVVLTIILSFVVSIGIFIYISTSVAGQLLFRWEEKIWSGFYSRSLPASLKPPGSFAPDDANPPRR